MKIHKKNVFLTIIAAFLLTAMPTTQIASTTVSNSRIIKTLGDYQGIQEEESAANLTDAEPLYVGIAEYYDNRKCVVTVTMDDLYRNHTKWEQALSMFTKKQIYHTAAVITSQYTYGTNWSYIQHWVDQGYTEAASHSRNHVHVPYDGGLDWYNNASKVSYEWQINGSKNDIIGNLTLPDWWRYGNREYVYAWIEPYGSWDTTVSQWLGKTFYLSDRSMATGGTNWATWDYTNGLFNRIGCTQMDSFSNSKFDSAYNTSGIYHLASHPTQQNWEKGSAADQHTDYISGRPDVWYVPFGLLYLYRWVDVRNIVDNKTLDFGQYKTFKLSINKTDHLNYGVSYPITYVFDIPSNWKNGYVYYRYLETDPWMLMENKSSEEFFNGITASRFDFTDHKAYVSVGFSDISHEIYLQLRSTPMIQVPSDYPTIQAAINAAISGEAIGVAAGTYYEHVIVNKTVLLVGEHPVTTIIDGGWNGTVVSITAPNVEIRGFTIQNGGDFPGISIWNCTGSTIRNSIVRNNAYGIGLQESNGIIIGNTVTNNSMGVQISTASSLNNTFHHNNFINNTKQVHIIDSANNTWDDGYPSGGNYWSDYNGTDDDGDGIGDTPYVIDINNQDNYPFMRPYDTISPISRHNYDGLWHNTDFTITLTATDYLSNVTETYYKINEGQIMNVSANGQPKITEESANNILEYWSMDTAGNNESLKILSGIKLDKTAPRGSIIINDGRNYTVKTSVTLSLSASDVTSGVTEVRFSNDESAWTDWEAYTLIKNWDLTPDDGTKTVYVQFKNHANLTSQSFFDTIILDKTPPTISITFPSNGSQIRLTNPTIEWNGTDTTSGIDYYGVSLDGGSWINIGTNTTYTFGGVSDGSHTVDILAVDKAGNLKAASINFVVNTSPIGGLGYIEEALLLAIIIIAAASVIAIYFLKIRRKA